MEVIAQIGQNKPLMCALLSWLAAQVIKTVIHLLVERKLEWDRLVGMGGMPSSHTAFVFSLCLMMGIQQGFQSPAFAISCNVLKAWPLAMVWVCMSNSIFIRLLWIYIIIYNQ